MEHDFSTIEGIKAVVNELQAEAEKINLKILVDIDFGFNHFDIRVRQFDPLTKDFGDTVYNRMWIAPLSTVKVANEITDLAEWIKPYKEDRVGQIETRISELTEELNAAKKELKKLKK